MVLGLGITRLLSSAVALFRSRGRAPLDWVPLVWAGCIFLWQLQFWWAIIELAPQALEWTPFRFLSILSLPLTLFLAAALILPPTELQSGDSLAGSFERDGRWALLFLTIYFVIAIGVNWHFWGVSIFTRVGLINLVLAALPLLFLSTASRKIRCALTLLYSIISPLAAWIESPHAY